MTIFFEDYYNSGIGLQPFEVGGEEMGFFDAMSTQYREQWTSGNSDSKNYLLQQEIQPIVDALKEREGIEFSLPQDDPGVFVSSVYNEDLWWRTRDLVEHLNSNPDLYPEYQGLTPDGIFENAYERARTSMREAELAGERETLMGEIGGFIGQSAGVVVDPNFIEAFVGTLFISRLSGRVGGPGGLGRQVLWEGAIGAGTEAYVQAGVADWYRELGLDYGPEEFLTAVAAGGIFGAGFPVATKAGAGVVSLTNTQIRKGIEVFRDAGYIKPKDAALALDDLDLANAVNDVPIDILFSDTFMPNAPEFVRPVRTVEETVDLNTTIYDLKQSQPFETMDQLYDLAPAMQDRLAATGSRIESELGVKFKNPGIKLRETSEEKLLRKSYTSPKELNDVVRGGFMVKTADQSDQVIVALAKDFDVIDEGWAITPEGYFDRKVLIKEKDGTLGEVQIWSERMLEAKENAGTDLYTKWRAKDTPDAEKQQLMIKMQELYKKALSGEHQSFTKLAGILNDPNLVAKVASKASREGITEAVRKTSSASTVSQPPPGSRMATADKPDLSSMAGRPSQEVKTASLKGVDEDISSPFDESIELSDTEINAMLEHHLKGDDAALNLERGNLPGDKPDATVERLQPQETMISEKDVDTSVDQVSRDTDFDNMADDEILLVDEIIDDQVVSRQKSGKQIKDELNQDQQMLDRLEGCVA